MSDIGLILLAAGASTRLGRPKQLLYYHNKTLIRHSVEQAIASVCSPIIVVLGAYANSIRTELSDLNVPNIEIIENAAWPAGMGGSIQAGMTALMSRSLAIEAVVLMLCDQPFVSTELIQQLIEVYRAKQPLIVASHYADTIGVPALFHHTLFSELTQLNGTIGARKIIQQFAHSMIAIPFPAGAIDIDTPTDYEQLQTDLS
jgi:molybdenum cofactor cytidylyltransferase